ncbi:hypothetical protein [Suttonella ornithocola]|uniref:hypothetical protein n=1 Tax=Suttonella ornithocola TaxID=279832 RepID=UPI0011609156|nr:hypothetical protein [Suttonella ornithocola]
MEETFRKRFGHPAEAAPVLICSVPKSDIHEHSYQYVKIQEQRLLAAGTLYTSLNIAVLGILCFFFSAKI